MTGAVCIIPSRFASTRLPGKPLRLIGAKPLIRHVWDRARESRAFDRVIVSGLPRTVETAMRVLAETGQQIQLETWPELAEIRGGKLSGIPDDKLREAFTGAFEGVVPEQRRFLGGESVGELMDRIHPAIARLLADASWDTALLVLHGGVNRATPLLLHNYALLRPRPAPAGAGFGPWLEPAMLTFQVPQNVWLAVGELLMKRLGQLLTDLAVQRAASHPGAGPIQIIDSQGANLVLADEGSSGASGDWANEIHPSRDGYAKVAARWAQALDALPDDA